MNKLLKAKDISEMLQISRSHAFHLMGTGILPSIRIGKSIRVRPEDLQKFISNQLVVHDFNNKKQEP